MTGFNGPYIWQRHVDMNTTTPLTASLTHSGNEAHVPAHTIQLCGKLPTKQAQLHWSKQTVHRGIALTLSPAAAAGTGARSS